MSGLNGSATRNETKIPANPATISVARRVIMSINVFNHSDAVKAKVVILAGFVLAAVLSSVEAGPRVGVHVRAGGAWCPCKARLPAGPEMVRPDHLPPMAGFLLSSVLLLLGTIACRFLNEFCKHFPCLRIW